MRKIIGYTTSDGTCLCVEHAQATALTHDGTRVVVLRSDDGNESGYVSPIFEGDEWAYIPTCDVCPLGQGAIEGVTVIGSDIWDVETAFLPKRRLTVSDHDTLGIIW